MIFTTQITELDMSSAAMFGPIVQVPIDVYRANLTADVKHDRVALIAATLDGENAQHRAYNPEKDVLLLVGDPVNIALVFHLAAERALAEGLLSVNTLRYDRRNDAYISVEVML